MQTGQKTSPCFWPPTQTCADEALWVFAAGPHLRALVLSPGAFSEAMRYARWDRGSQGRMPDRSPIFAGPGTSSAQPLANRVDGLADRLYRSRQRPQKYTHHMAPFLGTHNTYCDRSRPQARPLATPRRRCRQALASGEGAADPEAPPSANRAERTVVTAASAAQTVAWPPTQRADRHSDPAARTCSCGHAAPPDACG